MCKPVLEEAASGSFNFFAVELHSVLLTVIYTVCYFRNEKGEKVGSNPSNGSGKAVGSSFAAAVWVLLVAGLMVTAAV
jgi:hypothetical protein